MGADNMSSVALKLYQGLTDAGEDKKKAKIFATAFEELEQRYPEVKDLATGAQLTETSLLLQKEIKEIESNLNIGMSGIQKEIKEIESNLQKDMKEIESNLQKEMKDIEYNSQKDMKEIESNLKLGMSEIQKEMQENKIEMLKSISQQTWYYFTGLSVLAVVLTTTTAALIYYLK